MILCGSCSLPMEYSQKWHCFVHAVHTTAETLRALKCPALGRGIPQPYRVDDTPTFNGEWWTDRFFRLPQARP